MATAVKPSPSPRPICYVPLRRRKILSGWGFPEIFVLSQVVLPALLYLPGTQPLRVPIRTSAFAMSLAALGIYILKIKKMRLAQHPASAPLLVAMAYIALMILHPNTNSYLAGTAQTFLYLSVLAPVFWAPHSVHSPQQLRRLLVIVLICSGLNSAVGILQVRDPGRWMPKELSSFAMNNYVNGLESLTYINAEGQRVYRPAGLSDTPGGVAGPAMFAAVLGFILAFAPVALWQRLGAASIGLAGLVAILLSDVRTSLLIALGSLVVYSLLMFRQKQRSRAAASLIVTAAAAVVAFAIALSVGGSAIQERFVTLLDGDPVNVYFDAGRGDQIQYAFDTLVRDYPFGAGLGRWGMMRGYFGDPSNPNSPPIWAELQPNAWILDGGCVLLGIYLWALFVTARREFRLATSARSYELRTTAAMVLAINAGVLALIFGYTPFTTQIGLQYWFLTGALHGVARFEKVQ